ncbi:DinB family protein, partial [candidate division KSB1 bacterium]
MEGKTAAKTISRERHYLNNVLKDFKPEHGDFKPDNDSFTVAQQMYHIADTLLWFREGAFGSGFNMDFEGISRKLKEPRTFEEALDFLNKTYDDYIAFLEPLTEENLNTPLPDNPIFGNAPKWVIIYSTLDHTAHHRGALSVYLRLLG